MRFLSCKWFLAERVLRMVSVLISLFLALFSYNSPVESFTVSTEGFYVECVDEETGYWIEVVDGVIYTERAKKVVVEGSTNWVE